MLRVTVEIVPGGDEARSRILGRVMIANRSGLAPVSDYKAWHVGPDGAKTVAGILGHRRSDGWVPLLRRTLDALWPPVPPRLVRTDYYHEEPTS